MIRVQENRLAKLDLKVANVDNYGHHDDHNRIPLEYNETIVQKDQIGNENVNEGHPIPRDERRVVFEDQQIPEHHTGYDNKPYGQEIKDREMVDQLTEKVERLEKLLRGGEKRADAHGAQITPLDLTRPTYIKVHRKYMSPETLDEYKLPWEWLKVGPPHHLASCAADTVVLG